MNKNRGSSILNRREDKSFWMKKNREIYKVELHGFYIDITMLNFFITIVDIGRILIPFVSYRITLVWNILVFRTWPIWVFNISKMYNLKNMTFPYYR